MTSTPASLQSKKINLMNGSLLSYYTMIALMYCICWHRLIYNMMTSSIVAQVTNDPLDSLVSWLIPSLV